MGKDAEAVRRLLRKSVKLASAESNKPAHRRIGGGMASIGRHRPSCDASLVTDRSRLNRSSNYSVVVFVTTTVIMRIWLEMEILVWRKMRSMLRRQSSRLKRRMAASNDARHVSFNKMAKGAQARRLRRMPERKSASSRTRSINPRPS